MDTQQELHFIEQDINFKRAADKVIDVLGDIEFDLLLHDPAYRKSSFKETRNKIVLELMKSEEIRQIFSFPKELIEGPDLEEALNQLRDFVELTIKAELEVASRRKESLVEDCIRARVKEYLKKLVPDWKHTMQQRKAEFLAPAKRKIIEALTENAIDMKALREVLFDDLEKRTSMDLFGYFLRRLGFDKAGERVKEYMIEILESDLSSEVKQILREVVASRAELGYDVDPEEVMNDSSSAAGEILGSPADSSGPPDLDFADDDADTDPGSEAPERVSSEELPKVVIALPLEDTGEKQPRVVPELPPHLAGRISTLVATNATDVEPKEPAIPAEPVAAPAASEPKPASDSEPGEPSPEPEPVAEPEPIPASAELGEEDDESIEQKDENPDEVIKEVRGRPVIRRIIIGAIVVLVLLGGTCLLLRPKPKKGQSKEKDKIAQKTTGDMKAAMAMPPEVMMADAAIAGGGMDAAVTKVAPMDAMKAVASAPTKVPKRGAVTKSPSQTPKKSIDVKGIKSDPNLKRIVVSSVNDLPANYSESYKSLFLGQLVELNGMPLSEYIERAIKESCTPKQWHQYLEKIGKDLRQAYVLGNQLIKGEKSQRSEWYHNKFRKKQRGWYRKGQKRKAEYDWLLKRETSGKKMKQWETKRLKKLREMLKLYNEFYGGLANEKLMDKGVNVDEVPTGTGVYFSKDGYVPSIIVKMAEAADLKVPEELHTSIDKVIDIDGTQHANELSGEIMLAEKHIENHDDTFSATAPNITPDSTVQLDSMFRAEVNGYELQKRVDALRQERGKVMENAADKALQAVLKNKEKEEAKLEYGRDFASRTVDNILGKYDPDFKRPEPITASGVIEIKRPEPRAASGVIETKDYRPGVASGVIETKTPAPRVASGVIETKDPANDNHIPIQAQMPEVKQPEKSFFGKLSGKLKGLFGRKKAA